MKIERTLPVSPPVTEPIDGRYLAVDAAAGPFEISAKGMDAVEMEQGGSTDLPLGITSITIRNLSGANNQIRLQATTEPYRPAKLEGQVEARIPGNVNTNIEGVDTSGGAVPVELVTTDKELNTATRLVEPVQVSNTVVISPKPYGGYRPRPQHKFTTVQGYTVPANELRKELLVKADKNNIGMVWTGPSAGVGQPLEPGEPASFFMDDALPLYAEKLGDKIYIIEIEA